MIGVDREISREHHRKLGRPQFGYFNHNSLFRALKHLIQQTTTVRIITLILHGGRSWSACGAASLPSFIIAFSTDPSEEGEMPTAQDWSVTTPQGPIGLGFFSIPTPPQHPFAQYHRIHYEPRSASAVRRGSQQPPVGLRTLHRDPSLGQLVQAPPIYRQKLRCDGELPCLRCVLSGIPERCEYLPSMRDKTCKCKTTGVASVPAHAPTLPRSGAGFDA